MSKPKPLPKNPRWGKLKPLIWAVIQASPLSTPDVCIQQGWKYQTVWNYFSLPNGDVPRGEQMLNFISYALAQAPVTQRTLILNILKS